MYTRVSRTFLIVGRQWTKQMCQNTKSSVSDIIFCSPNINSSSAVTNVFTRRDFCDNKSTGTEFDVPTLMMPDEEAEKWLEEFLKVPENERIRKIVELEIEVLRQSGEKVPDTLKPRHWCEMLKLQNRHRRKKYLAFTFGLEKKKENERKAKILKQQMREENGRPDHDYILGSNSMFLRFYESSMNRLWHSRVISSMIHGQPLVLDCSYDSYMTSREMRYCAKQLKLCMAENRIHQDPFNIYLCNVDMTSETTKALHRFIPPLFDEDYPLNITPQSYLDIFDKDRLVYLTPHCREELIDYDHEAVYIIGAFIDKSSNEPVSLAKAKKLGIKTLKLPLDKYLQWGANTGKNLTLNAVTNILLDIKFTGNWEKALNHVPRRKLAGHYQALEERKLKKRIGLLDSSADQDADKDFDKVAAVNLNDSIPLQLPKIKIPPSYNNNPARFNKTRPKLYSSHKKDSVSSEKYDDSADFSMEARAKLKKKNWKN
ncbi:mitochondrial ribonuclease P protein 1 homolog [Venturia canescens]|uniref:mitochondrial ribonuclease P protein 1 homolog n=1 Tax=Venturia canescens TaxID=32260 RepID=UPI001C9CC67B|nr:mitochondrial ribonuclease P protein 1 homolog [Venturia canescens]